MAAEEKAFPTITEAPGLDKEDEVVDQIRDNFPYIGKQDARLGGRESIIEEATLFDSLHAAYRAGILGATATMQTTLTERGIEVDLTREIVYGHLLADEGLL